MATDLLDPRRPNWTIPPTAPTAPTRPTGPSVGSTLRAAAPKIGDASLASAGGAALAGTVNSLRQKTLDGAEPMAPIAAAPGQIPVDTRYQAPPAAAGSLLSQSETGRNIGNIVNALPGLRLPAGSMGRVAAATGATRLAEPAALAGAAARGYVAGDAAFPGVAPERAPALSPTPSIREPVSDARSVPYESAAPDLTGKIIRNGSTYTGSNIKAGADIVDPTGKLLNTDDPKNPLSLRTTGVSGAMPGAGGGRSVSDIYANTSRINGQISETARALDAYGPGGAGGGGPAGINGNGIFDTLRATQNSGVPATRAERMAQADLANRAQIAAGQNNATLRGQDIAAGTSRANTRDTVAASLRGQDMDYAEKLDSKRMDVAVREAQRRAVASAWQGTTDPQVAAARLAAAGYDPASALAVAGGQRAGVQASAENLGRITRAAGVTLDKDGKPVINPALQAVAENVISNAAPGVANASPQQQNARIREVQSIGQLASGLQEAQGGSLFQTLGIDKAPPAISALPNLQGATLRERGIGSPFANASRGDYELVQPDGTVMPIKRGRVGEKELDYLKQNGVSLRNMN